MSKPNTLGKQFSCWGYSLKVVYSLLLLLQSITVTLFTFSIKTDLKQGTRNWCKSEIALVNRHA